MRIISISQSIGFLLCPVNRNDFKFHFLFLMYVFKSTYLPQVCPDMKEINTWGISVQSSCLRLWDLVSKWPYYPAVQDSTTIWCWNLTELFSGQEHETQRFLSQICDPLERYEPCIWNSRAVPEWESVFGSPQKEGLKIVGKSRLHYCKLLQNILCQPHRCAHYRCSGLLASVSSTCRRFS